MRGHGKQPGGTAGHRNGVVSRFFLASVAIGLLLGFFEASLLWTTPRIMPLLVPDVGWVIWLLAPLVDIACFGLLGLLLGWLAGRGMRKEVLVAVLVGSAIAFVIIKFIWLHMEFQVLPVRFATVGYPLAMLALGTGLSLLVIVRTYDLLAERVEAWINALMQPVVWWALAAATLAMVFGIGVFVEQPTSPATSVQAAPPPTGAPNIVFITLDTVRADHLSAYGYSRPTTPNLDRFAHNGVLFENAIAPSSWTLASHASMFTGLLPQQHGADFAIPLRSGPWTIAEILRSQGYETAGFTANFYYMERGWGIAQGFEDYVDSSDSLKHNLAASLLGSVIIQPAYQLFYRFAYFDRQNAEQLNERVFRWLRHRPRRPFFLFLNYLDAHAPYVTSSPYNDRFGKVPEVLSRKLYLAEQKEASAYSFNAQERDLLIDGYDNCLAYLDGQVGNLLKFLHRSSEWQKTIVIITSDHGEEFGLHGSYNHGRNLYRGVLRVPLIIAGPGVPRGVRIERPVATRQLFSTILDMAGGDKTPFSRYSLVRFWNTNFKPKSFDDDVVSEVVPAYQEDGGAMISITTPRFQYIVHRSGREELYRWVADPEEQDNLAAFPQDQATLTKLRSRLINLVSHAIGPWRGREYLQALDSVQASPHLNLLFARPLQPGTAGSRFRIGIAQAYFRSQRSSLVRPSQPDVDLMKSLPYQ